MTPASAPKLGWGFAAGFAVAPGRTVVEPLGGGRRYDVYLVWDERLHALAVAKVLRPDRREDEAARRSFVREGVRLREHAHPSLVRALDVVPEGPYPHLLLEHLDAADLRRLVREQGPLPAVDVAEIGAQVAAALHYLAQGGIVHLDVKPSNVVATAPARLLDLGAARTREEAAALAAPRGTDPYMAPEVCGAGRGVHEIGPAADVWSLGATLYHAATGEVPFPRVPQARESPDPSVRYPQLVSRPEPLPDYVPRSLASAILGLLAPEPRARPSAAEAADALARLLP